MVADPLAVALRVAAVFEALDVAYAVGGSLASSLHGETRATMDVDFVAALHEPLVAEFVTALGTDFYADADVIREAVRQRRHFNVIFLPELFKADIFLATTSELDQEELERRQQVVVSAEPRRTLWVASPEDVVLQKLSWFRQGEGVSDRQWRDVLGVLRVQAGRLDRGYLESRARRAGLAALLDKALAEAEG